MRPEGAPASQAPVVQQVHKDEEGAVDNGHSNDEAGNDEAEHRAILIHHEEEDVQCQWLDVVEPWLLTPKTKENWIVFLLAWGAVAGIVAWFSFWGAHAHITMQACKLVEVRYNKCIHNCHAEHHHQLQ